MKKIIPLLIIITLAFGAVSATSFPSPTVPAPGGNIVPVHTGASQTKNGSLSVNTFIARAVASFQQQIYVNNTNLDKTDEGEKGNLKGSSVTTAENANLVLFGGVIENDPSITADDVTYDTSIIGTDIITAQNFLQSWNVSHDATIAQKRDLCADTDGNVVFCETAITEIDVCSNIQGTQTSPPTGMVQNLSICDWAVILPPSSGLAVSSIGCSMRPVIGGTYDDHVECSVNLNAPNNTGNDAVFSISYYYRNLANGSVGNDSGSIDVVVPRGEAGAISQTNPIDPAVTLMDWCINMNSAPAGISIPQARQC